MASLTKNPNVNKWVEEMIALTKPDKVVWIDGSKEQLDELRAEACATGEMIKLNEEKLPGTAPCPTTLPALKTEPSSAPAERKTQVPPTTGATPRRCTPSSPRCTTAL